MNQSGSMLHALRALLPTCYNKILKADKAQHLLNKCGRVGPARPLLSSLTSKAHSSTQLRRLHTSCYSCPASHTGTAHLPFPDKCPPGPFSGLGATKVGLGREAQPSDALHHLRHGVERIDLAGGLHGHGGDALLQVHMHLQRERGGAWGQAGRSAGLAKQGWWRRAGPGQPLRASTVCQPPANPSHPADGSIRHACSTTMMGLRMQESDPQQSSAAPTAQAMAHFAFLKKASLPSSRPAAWPAPPPRESCTLHQRQADQQQLGALLSLLQAR